MTRALVALALLTFGIYLVAVFLPPAAPQDPSSTRFEGKRWAESRCARCRRNLTGDPQDGLYLIGRKPFMLHRDCVEPMVRTAQAVQP